MVENQSKEYWRQHVQDMNIDTIVPDLKPENGATYYLIRHGKSVFNSLQAEAIEKYGWNSPQTDALKGDINLIDSDLHPIGKLECEDNADKLHPINFTQVFVSPMNRAMLTAVQMFKSHPNLANIKFRVLPIAREVFHSSCDIPQDIHVTMQRFAPGQPDAEGIVFDFSYLLTSTADPQLWSLATFADHSSVTKVLNEVQKTETGYPVSHEVLKKALMKCFMEVSQFETDRQLFSRAQSLKKFMGEYLLKNPVSDNQKIAIVCHSKLIASLTASGVGKDTSGKEVLQDFYWMKNCEIQPFCLD